MSRLIDRTYLCYALFTAGLASGCHSPQREFGANLRRVGIDAWNYYQTAQGHFVQAFERPSSSELYTPAMDGAIRNLKQAVNVSSAAPGEQAAYACPLFRTRLGWLYLYLDDDAQHLAEEQFRRSVEEEEGVPEWIPGWLGWSEWAMAQTKVDSSKAEDAMRYIEEAERQLDELVQRSQPHVGRFSLPRPSTFGAGLSGESGDSSGTKLSEGERLNLFWAFLAADEQWLDRNWLAVPTGQAAPSPVAITGTLEQRLRARVEYERAAVLVAKGENRPHT